MISEIQYASKKGAKVVGNSTVEEITLVINEKNG